uniref:C2 domain-containing protein n=1 Tax=Oryza nivara TaxID=4536 RepID=A0A0E0HZI2_ORYNI
MATIGLDKARVGCTRTLADDTTAPRWYESFHVYRAHLTTHVAFTLKAKNPIGISLVSVGYLSPSRTSCICELIA